jgi:hypothetical protein
VGQRAEISTFETLYLNLGEDGRIILLVFGCDGLRAQQTYAKAISN